MFYFNERVTLHSIMHLGVLSRYTVMDMRQVSRVRLLQMTLPRAFCRCHCPLSWGPLSAGSAIAEW